MLLPLTVSAVAAAYAGAVPLRFAFRLRLDDGFFFGTGLSAFEPRFALRRAQLPQKSRKKRSLPQNIDLPLLFRSCLRALKYLLPRLSPGDMVLRGEIGTQDAALTALICGSSNSLGYALRMLSGNGIRLNLRPDFSTDRLRVELSGMISVRAGHIMFAALLGACEYATGRFKTWINTPSKAL